MARLRLWFVNCLVCWTDLDEAHAKAKIDQIDEEGHAWRNAWGAYVLPPYALRRLSAADLCDLCWQAHREDMMRNNRVLLPPFRSVYLAAWLTKKLHQAGERTNYAMQVKADRAIGIGRKGSLRQVGVSQQHTISRHRPGVNIRI